MELKHACLLLLLFCSAYGNQFRGGPGHALFLEDPELEWERMETVIGEEQAQAPVTDAKFLRSSTSYGTSTSGAKKVPEYVIVSASKIQKEAFKPEKGARPLPNSVKELLLAGTATAKASGKAARPNLVEILCHVDRMYVRVLREIFKTKDAWKDLKLGSCPVNQGTKQHYYFLYLLTSKCAFRKENNVDDLSIRNSLSYNPSTTVVREMPFSIPLQCKFPRFFHSYKVGFYPKLQGGTVFKALQPKSTYTLTPQDASGNEITGAKTYTLGQPMFFEAKRPGGTAKSADQRIYVKKCFMTAAKDPNSNPKYTVIDNHGCMIDGKLTDQSKFLTGDSKMVQKFSIGALIFKDSISSSSSSQQLYMHCEISVGKLTPTASSKACNYDATTKKWKELYGGDSVCTCCDSSCSSAYLKASRNLISSHSWKVDLRNKDEDMDFRPLMKIAEADSINFEDPGMEEHRDFVNYWEHDY
ncbi:zona pellucida sperm-binding protein 3 [Notolabrus celidotus]|uniref:zona pellucida sperm-binding protein 3 n=1 Tax=Notolabrus celidotus TaxID=1203425 RepID=UPI00148F87E0|nr:zona pellucida sperm-binding protein 3 [Notolabrus celidotus]